jgi:hypothetical protein
MNTGFRNLPFTRHNLFPDNPLHIRRHRLRVPSRLYCAVPEKENWRALSRPPGTSQILQDIELSKPDAFR